MGDKDLEEALEMGMDWSLREGYCWAEDKEHCEEYGRSVKLTFDIAQEYIIWKCSISW